jgi:cytochrome c oxidase subunit 1
VLAVTVLLLAVEKVCGIGIFDPALEGYPLLFQHMFWFYSHPAVYIMILPGFAIMSEVIPCFSRKNIFGYKAVAWASVGIAVVGFLIWGHHMFVAGQGYYLSLVFSIMTMLVAVPSAIKVFNWTATMYRGDLWFTTPMVLAIGFLFLFTIGGLTGMHLGSSGSDIHLHDTYFVIAHFHFVMVGGYLVAYLAGLHFWWPKMTGRMYSEFWSKTSAMIIIVGFFLTFAPQFILGYMGMPRRYPNYPPEFQFLNVMSTAGASILGLGYAMVPVYLIASLFAGTKAGSNPWRATGLEWQTPSPPPMHNFDETPITYFAPYEYSLPNGLAQLAAAGKVVEVNGNGNGVSTTHGAHGEVISGS